MTASWWRPVLDDGFRCVVAVPAALSRGGSAALTLFLEDMELIGPDRRLTAASRKRISR